MALASSGTAVLFTFGARHLKDNASFRNGLRLVLLIFLISSTLWSILGFAATLISGDGNPSCQVLVAFAAGFDQLTRVAFEQYLVWRIKPKRPSAGIFVLQALMFVRFIIGGVLVGVQRTQVYPVCIARNILLPLGIATLATDALIASLLAALLWSSKSQDQSSAGKASSKIVAFLIGGFASWIAVSLSAMGNGSVD